MDKVLTYMVLAIFVNIFKGIRSEVEVQNGASSRIVNGFPVLNITEFPYVISLQEIAQVSQASRGHSCGGALVTYQHALTAASCLYTLNTQGTAYVLKTPAQWRVFAGDVLLTSDTANNVRPVSQFVPHPNYTVPSHHNNIGIIIVQSAFPNTTVAPLPISSGAAPAEFAACLAAGWGSTSYVTAVPNTQLMYAEKYIYSQQMCMVVLNPQPSAPNVLPTHVCAAAYTFSASCTGDVGNALVCGNQLVGILSWSPPCGAESSWPDVYTRSSNYSAWVLSVTGHAPTVAPALAVMLASVVALLFSQL